MVEFLDASNDTSDGVLRTLQFDEVGRGHTGQQRIAVVEARTDNGTSDGFRYIIGQRVSDVAQSSCMVVHCPACSIDLCIKRQMRVYDDAKTFDLVFR